MRKLLCITLVICVFAAMLIGCTPAASGGADKKPTTVYTLQIAHAQPETNPRHLSVVYFKGAAPYVACNVLVLKWAAPTTQNK